ncbi:hypothetical protein BuS5_00383 [Desulfosarcina sp. BuS5]|nr:hypothetical protein BuS5_00383 [Desulfosarcina sp. BuS5]
MTDGKRKFVNQYLANLRAISKLNARNWFSDLGRPCTIRLSKAAEIEGYRFHINTGQTPQRLHDPTLQGGDVLFFSARLYSLRRKDFLIP